MPYLQAMSNFRDSIRSLSRDKAPHTDFLRLADKLRDTDMVDLGILLEDQEDGKALLKLVDPEVLKAQREEKEKLLREKAEKKLKAKEKANEDRRLLLEKGKVEPKDMFINGSEKETFSKFDEEGIPTHDNEGKEVSKKKRKNLEKEREKQVKDHEIYLKAKESGEIQ